MTDLQRQSWALSLRPEHPKPSVAARMQRVLVRMLFDPAFVKAVYEQTEASLGGLELPSELIEQLLGHDRRLWNADRLRRRRALKTLMEEFKVSTALILSQTQSLASLDAFFSSEGFHESVQRRQYMALAFADCLQAMLDAGQVSSLGLEHCLRLEASMAFCRRHFRDAQRGHDADLFAASEMKAGVYYAVAPGVRAVTLAEGLFEVTKAVEEYLFEASLVPALALCHDAPGLEALPEVDGQALSYWLLEAQSPNQVDPSQLERRYHRLIEACHKPSSAKDLRRALRPLGIERDQAMEMVAALRRAGVLRKLQVSKSGAVTALGEGA